MLGIGKLVAAVVLAASTGTTARLPTGDFVPMDDLQCPRAGIPIPVESHCWSLGTPPGR